MKSIETILKEAGIEGDAVAGIVAEVNKSYRTVSDYEKQTKKLETAEQRATEAEETLKGFEGKDFDAITKERDEWKVKYETKMREDAEAAEKAELDEAISNAIKEAKGKNAKAIIAQLDMDAIKASKNRDKDIANAIKALSESEETAFLFDGNANDGAARPFTTPNNTKGGNGGTQLTKEDIMKVKDSRERQNLIMQNPTLFQ